jgi:ferric-dicitrate binding protein FerR (iron transport regulator)
MDKENDILKWFEGELSFQELQNKYPGEDFSTLEKVGFYSKQLQTPSLDVQKALDTFRARNLKKEEPKVIPLTYKKFLRIVAVLVVLLSSSYFLFFNTTSSFSTAIAQTQILTLPDNSEVILNAKSNISYSKKEWKKTRILNLEGEAFFKVTKGNKFIVNTEEGKIEVLGTQFNVKQRHDYFEVQCFEGSVSVSTNTKNVILTPGKYIRVIHGHVGAVENINLENPSWLSSESSFDKVPLWQVIKELEVQYDISINASSVDKGQLFTGTFTHSDKIIALQSVTIPLKLSYKINGKKVEFFNYGSN